MQILSVRPLPATEYPTSVPLPRDLDVGPIKTSDLDAILVVERFYMVLALRLVMVIVVTVSTVAYVSSSTNNESG